MGDRLKSKQEPAFKRLLGAMRRHKWRTAILGILLFIILSIASLFIFTYDPNPLGHFHSPEGENAYKTSYAKAMEQLPKPLETLNIKTDFGTVRVYKFGSNSDSTQTPIVLFPGRSSGVPMWSMNLKDLASKHTVYAFDALGDAGLSVQTKPIKDSADQALWIEQTFSQLKLDKVNAVGHSFGSWLTANYAARYPDRVANLALLEPVFVFEGISWQLFIKVMPATIPFLPQEWRDSILKDISGAKEIDHSDPLTQMISNATEHFAAKYPNPEQITPEQLQSLSMPVYVALAEKSPIHDSEAAMKVAKDNIKNVMVKIWPGATHSLPMEFAPQVDSEILDFIAKQR